MPAFKRTAAALSAAAILSMSAAPAMARGWGGWGGHRHHHRGGIDAGDVIAGVLILGGIAAVASAASKAKTERRDRDAVPPPPPEGRYDERDRGDRWDQRRGYEGGLNGAVDRCVGEVERGRTRVDTVDSAVRDGEGWRVEGRTDGGDFSCSIDEEGRVRSLRVDGRTAQLEDPDDAEEAEPAVDA